MIFLSSEQLQALSGRRRRLQRYLPPFFVTWGEAHAHEFLDELETALHRIGDSPRLGIARPDLGLNLRSFPHRPFIIIYRISQIGVEIARILDGRRDIRMMFRSEA